MYMDKINLGIVFGGKSTEHDVSIVSATSVIQNLNKQKREQAEQDARSLEELDSKLNDI